jgi:hypothetical protein
MTQRPVIYPQAAVEAARLTCAEAWGRLGGGPCRIWQYSNRIPCRRPAARWGFCYAAHRYRLVDRNLSAGILARPDAALWPELLCYLAAFGLAFVSVIMANPPACTWTGARHKLEFGHGKQVAFLLAVWRIGDRRYRARATTESGPRSGLPDRAQQPGVHLPVPKIRLSRLRHYSHTLCAASPYR